MLLETLAEPAAPNIEKAWNGETAHGVTAFGLIYETPPGKRMVLIAPLSRERNNIARRSHFGAGCRFRSKATRKCPEFALTGNNIDFAPNQQFATI
jgi:hypothetical protein